VNISSKIKSVPVYKGDVVIRDGWEVHEGDTIFLPQLTVTYTLSADYYWEDGIPVTAHDSVVSHELDYGPYAYAAKISALASYEALDDHNVRIIGLPGFEVDPARYHEMFAIPLPSHVFAPLLGKPRIFSQPEIERQPISFGPFRIDSWAQGDSINFERNPFFEGWDYQGSNVSNISIKFSDSSEIAAELVESGVCDYLISEIDTDWLISFGNIR
jgi:ABC-type transport system substrate-binding protein